MPPSSPHCQDCSGCTSCGGCSGCTHDPREITLTLAQARLLAQFAQLPFLPFCQTSQGPVLLTSEGTPWDRQLLETLATLNLITLDPGLPLQNYDYAEYAPYLKQEGAERGSLSLTDLGGAVLDALPDLL